MAVTAVVQAGEADELLAYYAPCHGPDGIARSADVPISPASMNSITTINSRPSPPASIRTGKCAT